MGFTLWTGDLRPFVLKECAKANCTPKHFELQDIKVLAEVGEDSGALQNAMRQDPLLLQKMSNAAKKVVEEDLAQLMAYWVGTAETDISKIEANNTLTVQGKQGQIQARLQMLPQNLAQTKIQILPKIEAAAKRVWEELCRTQAAYRKYLIRCGLSIAANTVKIVTTTTRRQQMEHVRGVGGNHRAKAGTDGCGCGFGDEVPGLERTLRA